VLEAQLEEQESRASDQEGCQEPVAIGGQASGKGRMPLRTVISVKVDDDLAANLLGPLPQKMSHGRGRCRALPARCGRA